MSLPTELIEHRRYLAKQEKLAEQGNAEAQFVMGQAYAGIHYHGRHVPTAIDWYTKAAEQGHSEAQFELGQCYSHGDGTNQDHGLSLYWYKKAAMQGHGIAQTRVALAYEMGFGVDKNLVEAYAWLRVSLRLGKSAWARQMEKVLSLDELVEAEARYQELRNQISAFSGLTKDSFDKKYVATKNSLLQR